MDRFKCNVTFFRLKFCSIRIDSTLDIWGQDLGEKCYLFVTHLLAKLVKNRSPNDGTGELHIQIGFW
jgi:hypothetical protein